MTNFPAVSVVVFLFISRAHAPWKDVTIIPADGRSICILSSRSMVICAMLLLLMSLALRVMTSHSG